MDKGGVLGRNLSAVVSLNVVNTGDIARYISIGREVSNCATCSTAWEHA